MKRFVLVLSVVGVGLVVSSCAVGIRLPATPILETSARLNGKVLSTTGGPGSYYFEYGATEARTQRTPKRAIQFAVNESAPVSQPIFGLETGTTYHYAVCAEDSENPGDAFCSPDQTFDYDTQDSVVGTGVNELAGFGLEESYRFDVSSGPSGENPGGVLVYTAFSGRQAVGEATCLTAVNNRAVIGLAITEPLIGGVANRYQVIVDGGPAGQDSIGSVPSAGPATDCASVPSDVALSGFLRSSIVVTDAQPVPSAN